MVFGTETDSGFFARDGVALRGECNFVVSVVRVNLEALAGAPSMFLERFEGELKTAGSMFSESELLSSKEAAEKDRFPGEESGCFIDGEARDAVMARQ